MNNTNIEKNTADNKLVITDYQDRRISVLFLQGKPYDIEVHEKDGGILGSIHVAKVKDIAANIDAAFIDIELSGTRITCFYSLKSNKHHIYTDRKVHEKLKAGDEIVVQIIKEAAKNKAPIASSDIAITGRYTVAARGRGNILFSSKIKDTKWKKEQIERLSAKLQEENFIDIIVRTGAYQANEALIESEAKYLSEKLKLLLEKAYYKTAPSLVAYDDKSYINIVKKIGESIDFEIISDVFDVYEDLIAYAKESGFLSENRIRYYQDDMLSLIKLYALDGVISEALAKKVWLKSGAYIVIEHTEALTVIDVNTGKNGSKSAAEEVIRKTNLEAMYEITRQFRMRNLSGIILVDFIDMKSAEDREQLLYKCNAELKKDFLKAEAIDFTALNLMEITRQKIKKPLYENFK